MTRVGYKQTEGHKRKISAANSGKVRSAQHCENISKAKAADKNGLWQGDAASYQAKHTWIRKYFGTPQHCENCNGENAKSATFDWANITGNYSRERADYLRLCRSCHIRHDRYGMDVAANFPIPA